MFACLLLAKTCKYVQKCANKAFFLGIITAEPKEKNKGLIYQLLDFQPFNCGVGEIRTREPLLATTRFPGVRRDYLTYWNLSV